MKIRNRWLIWMLGFVGAWMVRLWIGTLRYRFRSLGPEVRPTQPGLCERYIYAFWHENLLLPACHYGRPNVRVLISQHADGQLIAEICRHLGFGLVRGSTTRGGVEAVREMLHAGPDCHLAITPDGPRGPRRQAQSGLVYLAAWTGMPIVPAGIGYHRPWRARSWDRFAVPRPWTRATCVIAEPVVVPANADREELERYRVRVEEAMRWATEAAEHWAETGKWEEEGRGKIPSGPSPLVPRPSSL
jgi:lysophospholipid acyltransferase (LPLAT)-like uncharacterized protein